MAEALWTQLSGVDYSAAEDRRLITAVYNPGVINGLTITAGSGLAVSVSAGRAVVSDGLGGGYLCYFDAATTVSSLPASSTANIYVSVHPTTGQALLTAATTPPTDSLSIGSVTTSVGAVTSVSNARTTAASPAAPQTSTAGAAGAIHYRSGTGFSQVFVREATIAAANLFSVLPIQRTGTPNTSTYGNFVGTGSYGGLWASGADTLIAPTAGYYALSAACYAGPQTGTTGSHVLRVQTAGRFGRTVVAQTHNPIFEDHVGSDTMISVQWTGYMPAGATMQVKYQPYTSVNMTVSFYEFNWARLGSSLTGGATV